MEDRCVCCGAIIPEGQQVCIRCLMSAECGNERIVAPEGGRTSGKKKKGPDKLAQEAAAAKAAGMSYGKWKAMQSAPVEVKKEIPDGWRVCEYCGRPYKPKTKRSQKYCEVYCAKHANDERNRKRRNEYAREWRKRKREEEE